MAEAFIYDHVRTPRGRGKADGSLHEVSTLNLAAAALKSVRDRNELDTHLIDDVVMGCVDPIGEAGSCVPRIAALVAGYGDHVPGIQINRFCASGLDAVNFAAAQVMSGQHDMTVGGGVEFDESCRYRLVRRRLGDGPGCGNPDLLHAAGHFRRPDGDEIRFFAR